MNKHQNGNQMKSLDPRVARLPETPSMQTEREFLDQLTTFEVFVQPKEGKPFQHEGSLHASDLEMAFVLAKETFTRRFTCVSLFVANTSDVFVSDTSEGETSIYESINALAESGNEKPAFEIFHLLKRGKQHIHAGTISAASAEEAIALFKDQVAQKVVYNVWVIAQNKIRFTLPDENGLWLTLPEKKFRDATEYKGGDKLKNYLETQKV